MKTEHDSFIDTLITARIMLEEDIAELQKKCLFEDLRDEFIKSDIQAFEVAFAKRILSYRKNDIIKYFNKKVSCVRFMMIPMKMYKIEDISFAVLSSGTLLVLLSVKGDTPIEITLENGKVKLYEAFGTCLVGPGVKYDKQLISKTEDVLLVYFECLKRIRTAYPNQNLFFGNCNREQLEMFAESERINSELEKQYQEKDGKNL